MTDAFEQAYQAKRLGEGEAGTKLLLPLFVLLISGHGHDSCSGADGIQVKHKEESHGIREKN